jgi:hypothetical protein
MILQKVIAGSSYRCLQTGNGYPVFDFFPWMTCAVPFRALFLLIAWLPLTYATNRHILSGDPLGTSKTKG